jgi:hypothetical protein
MIPAPSAPLRTSRETISGDASQSPPASDPAFAELQELLFGQATRRLEELNGHYDDLQHSLLLIEQEIQQLKDIERLAERIKPSLAPAIRASISESREGMVEALTPIIDRLIAHSIETSRESMVRALMPIIDRLISVSVRESSDAMVDALYPIIGRLVSRAVAEALRDLARRIDDQMRSALNIRLMLHRLQARMAGVSEAELALRLNLPFQVLQIFLIHRETGLLLNVLAQDPETTADSDVISGMLTAIRDFVQDTIGRDLAGDLDEIQYGDKRILLESARYTYIALVAESVEPIGFRAEVRARLLDLEHAYASLLRNYQGDARPFAATSQFLQPLLITSSGREELKQIGVPYTPLVRNSNQQFNPLLSVRLTFALLILVGLLSLWRVWFLWIRWPLQTNQVVERFTHEVMRWF